MHIKEIHEILQNLKNGKVTQNDIARAIGTSRANVSKLFAKNSMLNDEKIKKIEEYFEISLDSTNSIVVDYYPDTLLTMENGAVEFSKKCVKCKIPALFFEPNKDAKYVMCHAQGDSMYPLIWNGDVVIIECIENFQILNNKIYAFIYENNFYINRLAKNITQYVVKSENKDFSTQYIEKEETKNLKILGRVVYVGKNQEI